MYFGECWHGACGIVVFIYLERGSQSPSFKLPENNCQEPSKLLGD